MKLDEKIKVGDFVGVEFSSALPISMAEVLYIPGATGDCWRLKKKNGKIIYIQIFERMDLIRK